MPDFQCYASLAMLRQKDNVKATDTTDDPRRVAKLRDASAAIYKYCAERNFQPVQETRTFDWTSNEYLSFRGFDLLTLTSVVDGTGNTKQAAALIMQGGRFSDSTRYGPWYALRIDTTKDFLLYNVTPFRCIQVTGTWGYYDDYGLAGANAWTPVYTDATLATPLHPSGATSANQRVIPLNADPTQSVDGWLQNWAMPDGTVQGAISPGSLMSMDSEWFHVLAVNASTPSVTVMPAANGTTAATHGTSSNISVFQPQADIRDACITYAQFLLRQDDAPMGKTLMPAMGQVIVPDKKANVAELLEGFIKRRVA